MTSSFMRTILVTGATDGIGKETATQLAKNAQNFVVVHGRNEQKCRSVVDEITRGNGGRANVDFVLADFAALDSIPPMADSVRARFPALNVIICNAGISTQTYRETKNGLETMFQVNHLAHFLLVTRLLDLLTTNAPSRVVVVSSIAHSWQQFNLNALQKPSVATFDMHRNYGLSKLCNHLFTFALVRRLEVSGGRGVSVNVLEPGIVDTTLLDDLKHHSAAGPQGSSVADGAKASIALAQSVDASVTGKYFSRNATIIEPSEESKNVESQEKLWQLSEEILRKQGFL